MKDGFNPMRWDCETHGCYNVKCRPKIELFADIWPGRISMGDVDGIVEIAGNALILEWKRTQAIPVGQRIMYERLTKGKHLTVLCVVGNAETMAVSACKSFVDGEEKPKGCWETASLVTVREKLASWREFAERNPR